MSIIGWLVGSFGSTTIRTRTIQTMMEEERQDYLSLWTTIRYNSADYQLNLLYAVNECRQVLFSKRRYTSFLS